MSQSRVMLVYTRGGTPLEYAIPRIAARAELYVLEVHRLPAHTKPLWGPHCTEIIPVWDRSLAGEDLVSTIVSEAKRIGADAFFTISEFVVLAAAEAAARLGLRSAGPHADRARDKRLMRQTWERAGVPSPRFRPVSTVADVHAAYRQLTPPVLLKAAWSAGAVGQRVIDDPAQIDSVWQAARTAVADAHRNGYGEPRPGTEAQFLVEEVIRSGIQSWWEEGSGYGDYLSVEGIVADGTYHPLCITTRIPTIPPFTELSNLAPCVLPEDAQRRIERVARAAVDALELDTCGTHTELKLLPGGGVSVLESAARFGGVMVLPEIEHCFGYDPIGMLTDALLGRPVSFPERMLTDRDASAAAGSLSLIATDASGEPWSQDLVWDESRVDWSGVVSPQTRIEAVPGLCIPSGTPMPRYDISSGALGYGGIFFLRTSDAATLVRDSHSVLNNLEAALARGQQAGASGD